MAVHAESSIQLNTIPGYTSLLGGHFVYKSTDSQSGLTKPSANVIQNVKVNNVDVTNDPTRWGYNTHIGANGIKLRYNEIDLSEWSAANGLKLYYPVLTNGVITNSQLGAQFTANDLSFYKPGGQTASAVLNSNGLNIAEGTITLGTFTYQKTSDITVIAGKNYYYYLSDEDRYVLADDPDDSELEDYYERVPQSPPAFQVDSDGYLKAREGWIGGVDSYIKLEKDEEGSTHYLDIRLSQLEVLVGQKYGQDNIINVLDLIAQQSDFIDLWNGDVNYFYQPEPDGPIYTVYEFIGEDEVTRYYYNENQFVTSYEKAFSEEPNELDGDEIYYKIEGGLYVKVASPTLIEWDDYYILVQEEAWVEYMVPTGQEINLPSVEIAGLGRALKFEEDTNGNFQALRITSGSDTISETIGVIIDPHSFEIYGNNSETDEANITLQMDNRNINIYSDNDQADIYYSTDNSLLNMNTGIGFGNIKMYKVGTGIGIGVI